MIVELHLFPERRDNGFPVSTVSAMRMTFISIGFALKYGQNFYLLSGLLMK